MVEYQNLKKRIIWVCLLLVIVVHLGSCADFNSFKKKHVIIKNGRAHVDIMAELKRKVATVRGPVVTCRVDPNGNYKKGCQSDIFVFRDDQSFNDFLDAVKVNFIASGQVQWWAGADGWPNEGVFSVNFPVDVAIAHPTGVINYSTGEIEGGNIVFDADIAKGKNWEIMEKFVYTPYWYPLENIFSNYQCRSLGRIFARSINDCFYTCQNEQSGTCNAINVRSNPLECDLRACPIPIPTDTTTRVSGFTSYYNGGQFEFDTVTRPTFKIACDYQGRPVHFEKD